MTSKEKHKTFSNPENYYKFCKKPKIKIIKVENTHNYKIRVTYVIIK